METESIVWNINREDVLLLPRNDLLLGLGKTRSVKNDSVCWK